MGVKYPQSTVPLLKMGWSPPSVQLGRGVTLLAKDTIRPFYADDFAGIEGDDRGLRIGPPHCLSTGVQKFDDVFSRAYAATAFRDSRASTRLRRRLRSRRVNFHWNGVAASW